MIKQLKQDWQILRTAPAGQRFSTRAKTLHSQSLAMRVGYSLVGLVCIIAGIVMLVIPGPGLVFMILGLALLAGESTKMAGFLDKGDLLLHRIFHKVKSDWQAGQNRVLIILAFLLLSSVAGAFLFASYWFFIR